MIAEAFANLISGGKQAGTVPGRTTELGSIAFASVEPLDFDVTRWGHRFSGIGIAAGLAPVAAVPTTTATHVLYNPGTLPIGIDELGYMLISGTPAAGASLLGIVSPITATLPVLATGSLISSRSGSARLTKAYWGSAYTLPALAGGSQWFHVGASDGGVSALGSGKNFDEKGRIIIPPNFVLGLAILAGAGTTPLFAPTATFMDANVTLE